MDSVQESSRCKQTKPSLWPTRPAGRIRDHSPVARAGLSPGLAWYAPRAIASRTPSPGLSEGPDHGGREIARKGSPQPAAVPRTRHTHQTDNTRRKDTPGTPTDRSRQHAIGSWQMAVLSTQHRKEVKPHMHTPATTHPQDRHAQWKSCTGPDTRRTHPTGTPRPGQRSRSGSGSGSGSGSTLDAGRPGPPHRPHPNHHRFHCRCRCRCDRAGTPAPSVPAPVGHPDPGHTGLRRCQPEPRPKPTWLQPRTPGKPQPRRR